MKRLKRIICIIMAAVMLAGAPLTSYLEAQAAENMVWALKSLLENVMISAGLSAAGYVSNELSISDEDFFKTYIKGLDYAIFGRQNPFLSSFLDQNGEDYLGLCIKYKAGEFINASNGGITLSGSRDEGLKIGLSHDLTNTLSDAVKQYLKSGANVIDKAYGKEEEGTVTVDSDYVSSITTTVNAVTSLKSMNDIDDYFSIEGAAAYLKAEGYSDNKYYFLINAVGSLTYIMPIPINYSVVAYRLSWLGKTGICIMSNLNYKNALSQCGVRDASSFSSYFNGLPFYTGRYYKYNASSGAWTVENDANKLPSVDGSFNSFNMTNWYFCNGENAYSNGCTVSVTRFGSEITRKLYTYKTTGNAISYDPSRAIDYTDGISFSFSDSDVMDGLDGYDIDSLMGYLSTLSKEMEEWRQQQTENQETIIGQNKEIIEQNKNLLSAVGGINSTSAKINTGIGKTVSILSSIADRLLNLPTAIFNAFSGILGQFMTADALVNLINGLPALLSPAFVAAVDPVVIAVNAMSATLAEQLIDIFPNSAEVAQAILGFPTAVAAAVAEITFPSITVPDILIPDIVIPEIKIPEIVIPEIKNPAVSVYPNITLDPTYDITVKNDYLGLGDIITDAVEDAGTKLFVPNQALTLEKVDSMKEYFKFKDDLEDIVSEFERKIFGIKPDPILKIPIGKPTSKKYKYGTGSYITIDVSWYAVYKDFGDKIILAFAWAFFIWRIFVNLPGIINGLPGLYETGSQAQTIVSLVKDSKKN